MQQRIFPVIMSGGSGTRLWPLSREAKPKQFLHLVGETSLFRQAMDRVAGERTFESLTVISSVAHRFLVGEELRIAERTAAVVLEPFGRNTAAAAAIAAYSAVSADPEALILLMPADHVIGELPKFSNAVVRAAEAAAKGYLVLFGVKPVSPATGYGYIRRGDALPSLAGAHGVEAFVEKPDLEKAQSYLADGRYLWNCGIFLMRARSFLDELQRLEPEIAAGCKLAWESAVRDGDFIRLAEEPFRHVPSISIDYAVMERTGKSAVVPVDFPWSDVGGYAALWEMSGRDDAGNASGSRDMIEGARNCYLYSEAQRIAALGVEDLIVVATEEAILVARKDRDQDVKKFVDRLKAEAAK
jgi:mannose-1-phosphate guanylyltransferase/mannose-1-phosphate guanylyltransferase/mannose-6-phosphate isomerase